jgi:dipeptidyl aminopeptidase/acylaminoacyl peptidase
MLYSHTGPTSPGDLWVYTLADGKSHQLTHSLVGGVRAEDMVEPSLVHYPSKDGKWTISAFVYVPYNLPRNGEHPAIVYVHGGPTAQTMNGFNRFVQPNVAVSAGQTARLNFSLSPGVDLPPDVAGFVLVLVDRAADFRMHVHRDAS